MSASTMPRENTNNIIAKKGRLLKYRNIPIIIGAILQSIGISSCVTNIPIIKDRRIGKRGEWERGARTLQKSIQLLSIPQIGCLHQLPPIIRLLI